MISLRKVTSDNYKACMLLEVATSQRSFVASNSWSISQWKFNPQFVLWAIYSGEEMVGFLMHEFENEKNETGSLDCWFFRFMIDQNHQRKGFGRTAFGLFLNGTEQEPVGRFQRIALSLEPENTVAIRFYQSFGFKPTGLEVDREIMFARSR